MGDCINKKIGALLHAYELNALDEKDVERFEIHILECEYCLHELKSFEKQSTILKDDDGIRKMLMASVGENESSNSSELKLWKYLWPKTPYMFRPLIIYVILFIFLIPAYMGLFMRGDQNSESQSLSSFEKVQKITLISDRSVDESVLRKSDNSPTIINFYLPEAVEGETYGVQIYYLNTDSLVEKDKYYWNNKSEIGTVYIPLDDMQPGLYRLDILDLQSDISSKIKSFEFEISE